MRNLGGLNNIYNDQDVILLTEVIRIVNPLNTLSGLVFPPLARYASEFLIKFWFAKLSHFFHNFIIG